METWTKKFTEGATSGEEANMMALDAACGYITKILESKDIDDGDTIEQCVESIVNGNYAHFPDDEFRKVSVEDAEKQMTKDTLAWIKQNIKD